MPGYSADKNRGTPQIFVEEFFGILRNTLEIPILVPWLQGQIFFFFELAKIPRHKSDGMNAQPDLYPGIFASSKKKKENGHDSFTWT